MALPPFVLAAVAKLLHFAVQGQSNEANAAVARLITLFGGLLNNNPSGIFPRMIEKISARLGHYVTLRTGAAGSTSLVHNFTGYCQTWVTGMNVVKDSYILTPPVNPTAIWKCNNVAGSIYTSTDMPTGTANITTNDGRIWTYLGVPGARDTPGRVYEYTDTGRWDPSNYLGASSYGIGSAIVQPYNDIIAWSEWGQTDGSLKTPRAAYAQGHINLALANFNRGATKQVIALSLYTTAQNAWYVSDLWPGVQDALAYFAADPRVFAGPNLSVNPGAMSQAPVAGQAGFPGAGLHANDPGADRAAEVCYDMLLAAKLI